MKLLCLSLFSLLAPLFAQTPGTSPGRQLLGSDGSNDKPDFFFLSGNWPWCVLSSLPFASSLFKAWPGQWLLEEQVWEKREETGAK